MDLMSDILMGQHLRLTGTLSIIGVQAPICHGDNLEWDGVVFHIESISHQCQIAPDGKKVFATTLSLSHGIRVDPGAEDIAIYAGITAEDQTSMNPGLTDEGQNNKNVLKDPSGTNGVFGRRQTALNAKIVENEGSLSNEDIADVNRTVK
jgi:hypothetical protein